ncbi:MAG: Holliday junction branch migration protein RuvA [Proteobacteria bacterium]|nr:Holliday junction branch migration protein RuvA [Pseudomonadota bacterium]
MIAKLTGALDRIYEDAVLLDVKGVAYRVLVSKRTLHQLPDLNSPLVLWTETVLRNEQPHLCGFLEEQEVDWFRILTQVQGVGAKVALSILSSLTASEISDAILNQKSSILSKADGVGPKLASRIVLELKGKKDLPVTFEVLEKDIIADTPESKEIDDAISALVNLGYNKHNAESAVSKASKKMAPPITLETLVRLSLQEFQARYD